MPCDEPSTLNNPLAASLGAMRVHHGDCDESAGLFLTQEVILCGSKAVHSCSADIQMSVDVCEARHRSE